MRRIRLFFSTYSCSSSLEQLRLFLEPFFIIPLSLRKSFLLICVLRLWLRYFLIVKLFSGLEQREYFLSHSNEPPPPSSAAPLSASDLVYLSLLPPFSICLWRRAFLPLSRRIVAAWYFTHNYKQALGAPAVRT